MSVSGWELLRRRISAGEFEQALQSVPDLAVARSTRLSDFSAAIHHAIYARQTELTLSLLEGTRRFFAVSGPDDLRGLLGLMTAVLAACTREKIIEPAQKTTEMVLELMSAPSCPASGELLPAGAKFAGWAGRFALRRNDLAWFAEIVSRSVAWAAKAGSGQSGEAMLETVDSWLHRILRYDRVEAIPVVFEALSVLYDADEEKNAFLANFLTGWRAVAAMACLNPESPAAFVAGGRSAGVRGANEGTGKLGDGGGKSRRSGGPGGDQAWDFRRISRVSAAFGFGTHTAKR